MVVFVFQWTRSSTGTSAVWAAAPNLTSTTSTTGSTSPVTLPYRSVETPSSSAAPSGDSTATPRSHLHKVPEHQSAASTAHFIRVPHHMTVSSSGSGGSVQDWLTTNQRFKFHDQIGRILVLTKRAVNKPQSVTTLQRHRPHKNDRSCHYLLVR